MLQSIKYRRGSLEILNQLLLPFETVYEEIKDSEDGFNAIRSMKVRGAPAIAIVAALSLAVEVHVQSSHAYQPSFTSVDGVKQFILQRLELLKKSRPTAVNLFKTADALTTLISTEYNDMKSLVLEFIVACEDLLQKDLQDNHAIGVYGADFIQGYTKRDYSVLTHCNTGSLATAGWGTALGIIREMHKRNSLHRAFCTETRPYNQGSRLTAYELVYENIPATLVCDSMVSALIKNGAVDAIVVGADRVAANGDTANKIGTYQLAIVAKYHNIPFIVAAPTSSIDFSIESGDEIVIEERPAVEMTQIRGLTVEDEAGVKEPFSQASTTRIKLACDGIEVWNPAFDVTPAQLVTAIVTEKGVFNQENGRFYFKNILHESPIDD